LFALLAYHLFRLVLTVSKVPHFAAALAVFLILISPPLIVYSGQIYPEIAAALLVVIALRALLSERALSFRLGACTASASILPWLNTRYAPLTTVLFVMAAMTWRGERRAGRAAGSVKEILSLALPPALILGSLGAFNLVVYGQLAPFATFEEGHFRVENLYLYGVGGLIGVPLGIIPVVPLLGIAMIAAPMARRNVPATWILAGVLLSLLYVASNAFFGTPGFSPVGRYFVAVIPLLAVPLAVAVAETRWVGRTAVAVGAGLSIVAVATSATHFEELYAPDRIGDTGVDASAHPTRTRIQLQYLQPAQATAEAYPFVLKDLRSPGFKIPARHLDHQIGSLAVGGSEETLLARSPRNTTGILASGPHLILQPGRYQAEFRLWTTGEEARSTRARVEVFEGGEQLAGRDVGPLAPGMNIVSLPFETGGALPIELRVSYVEGTLGVQSISATTTRPGPLRRTEAEWWKVLVWIGGGVAMAMVWAASRRDRRTLEHR
jgi:hypothetical protein